MICGETIFVEAYYDGEMDAGPAPGGGFTLSARLPLDGYQP